MLRTSSFLAIALGATAIVSVSVPAAANQLQVYGGKSRIVAEAHPIQSISSVQPNREASHVLGPQKVVDYPPKIPTAGSSKVSLGNAEQPIPASHGATTMKNAEQPMPASHGGTTMKNAEFPPDESFCAKHPAISFCANGGSGNGGGSGTGGGSGSAGGGSTGSSAGGGSGTGGGSSTGGGSAGNGKGPGGGPVVIVVPRAPIQVPVPVPVDVPVIVPGRVGASSVATTRVQPVITPACMTAADIPALAAGIDQLLPTARLSDADMAKVTELRQVIQMLATDGKVAAARDVEEDAMNILGYQKVWLRCGAGTFDWEQRVASANAGQQK
jgi:hypothetical protein